ncbi:MAG TPA: DnaJ domain-containing protein, partial [bacterium]|nr:DnaJ domain-containing protein [bacterium]
FQFIAGAPPPPGAFAVDLPVDDLIQRGLKEAFDLERIQKFLGSRLKSPAEKDLVGFQSLEKLKLTPAEFRLSRMIDGKKTVDAIAKEWAAGDAAKEMRAFQILFLMEEAGMVRLNEWVEPRAPGSTGPAPAAKPVVNLEELKKTLAEYEKKTLFEVLGVSKTSTPSDAKKAYFALAKKYHPDTIPTDASPEHRKLVEQIFAIIGRANSVLEDPKQREQYLMDLEVGGDGANLEAEGLLNAELEFQKGEFFLLKKKDAAQAEKHLAIALKLNPKEGEHHILWGWLLFLKSKGGAAAEAEKYILNGLKMRENNVAVGFLFLGHIYKAKNDIAKAEKYYQKCVSIDEKNAEAMSELRVIAMRKGKK